jgi:hypothetical protein
MDQRFRDWDARQKLARLHSGWLRPKTPPDVGDRVLCISSCDDHLVLDYAGAGDFVDPETEDTIAVKWWQPLTWPTDTPEGGGNG